MIAKYFRLLAYYCFARHLPQSSTRGFRWLRALRSWLCIPLFRHSGKNINVEKGAYFGSGRKISIGCNSGLGVNCRILGEVIIGNNVMMGPDALFLTTVHRHDRVDIPMIAQGFGAERPITIRDDVWIGARCIFLPGVEVRQGTIVGAGSVVTRSFPEYVVIAGNPARVVKQRT